jgi:hypothetical protein
MPRGPIKYLRKSEMNGLSGKAMIPNLQSMILQSASFGGMVGRHSVKGVQGVTNTLWGRSWR